LQNYAAEAVPARIYRTDPVAQFCIVMSGWFRLLPVLSSSDLAENPLKKYSGYHHRSDCHGNRLTLAANALKDACAVPTGVAETSAALASNLAWIISLVTLLTTILLSVYLKGFGSQLTLLFGPIAGCIVAFIWENYRN
jgi:uracil permease